MESTCEQDCQTGSAKVAEQESHEQEQQSPAKKNRFGAPYIGITIPCGLYSVFVLSNIKVDLQQQIVSVINGSALVYPAIYRLCTLSMIRALLTESNKNIHHSLNLTHST